MSIQPLTTTTTATRFAHDLDALDVSEPFTRRSASYTARRLLRRARRLLGDRPLLLPIVLWGTPDSAKKRAISADTVAVIEGFPRSGNTFAYFALQESNGPSKVSSHVHVPAQVRKAVAMGKPTLFVVREPVACLSSLLTAAPHVRIGPAYDEYIHHHEQVLQVAEGLVVATFEQITKDFGGVLEAMNKRFGTDFKPFDNGTESTNAVFARIDAHYAQLYRDKASERVVPRPSPARAAEKQWLTDNLTSDKHAAKLKAAQSVYERLAALS